MQFMRLETLVGKGTGGSSSKLLPSDATQLCLGIAAGNVWRFMPALTCTHNLSCLFFNLVLS